MRPRDIKTKRVWKRIMPAGYMSHGTFTASSEPPASPVDDLTFRVVTQADFIREYYPSGHVINDPHVYPDIYWEEWIEILDEEGNPTNKKRREVYIDRVPRFAFAFQQIITLKQCVHLCGNDIQFELNIENPTESQKSDLTTIRFGWADKDMEIAFFESVKSEKKTGDTAFVGYIKDGTFGYKVLSYADGDTLYPHRDSVTGEMCLFARSYYDYDEGGNKITEWLEVWDKTFLTRYKRNDGKNKTVSDKIKEMFGIDGYSLVEKKAHGFPFVPVEYKRNDDGACWSPSQDSIDGYELSFSQMMHSNQALGVSTLVLQGDGATDISKTLDMNGTVRVLTMGKDDKASILEGQSVAESYEKQNEMLYKMIYEQSFTVIPPELKSGDLPAAALKILYSPAYEKAIIDAAEWQPFLNGMVKIFAYGYGVEKEKTIDFSNLPIKWWIKPYVHLNDSSIMTDLAQGVQNGFISRQTASETASMYTSTGEWERILREKKAEQQEEIKKELQSKGDDTDIRI